MGRARSQREARSNPLVRRPRCGAPLPPPPLPLPPLPRRTTVSAVVGRAEVPLWDPHPPLPVLELLLLLNEPFNHSLQLWPI